MKRTFVLNFSLDLEGYDDVHPDLILEDIEKGSLLKFIKDVEIQEVAPEEKMKP